MSSKKTETKIEEYLSEFKEMVDLVYNKKFYGGQGGDAYDRNSAEIFIKFVSAKIQQGWKNNNENKK